MQGQTPSPYCQDLQAETLRDTFGLLLDTQVPFLHLLTMMDELIELNASQAFSEKLDSLRSGGMTRADVIRQAVVLLSYATEQEREGRQLGFVVRDGEGRNVVEEILQVNP